MFARVITARTGDEGFDHLVRAADQELPGARQRPGFAGYYLLTDERTGTALVISLWHSREDMEAVAGDTDDGIHGDALPEGGTAQFQLATYEVAVQA